MTQQGDIHLFQTVDDGDVDIVGGVVQMDGGLGTSVYLSLFGGNEDDDGSSKNKFTWWANYNEIDTAKTYRSETQFLLKSLPATSNNLKRIEQAVIRDLSYMIDKGIASDVISQVTIPRLNKVDINIMIQTSFGEIEIKFTTNWLAK